MCPFSSYVFVVCDFVCILSCHVMCIVCVELLLFVVCVAMFGFDVRVLIVV